MADSVKTVVSEDFQTVKRKGRKRQMKEDNSDGVNSMDTSEIAIKRPHLPPATGDNISVIDFLSCLFPDFADSLKTHV